MPLLALAAPAFAESAAQRPLPSAKPAMNGAQPRSRPVSPPVPSTATVLMHQLSGDAMFSLATFAVLLVPISGYGVLARQRERREAEEAAERRQREAAAGPGGLPDDPLLEFFAPLQPRPADLPPAATPRFQARPGLTGRSTMSAPLGGRSAFTPSPQPSPPRERPSRERPILAAPAAEATESSSQTIQVAGIGADSTVRRVQVSGTPPWEPAYRPTTELPWAVLSASGAARAPGTEASSPAIPPPPDSVWDSAPAQGQRSSAPKSLFEPSSAPPPVPRSSQPRSAPPGQRQALPPGQRQAPPPAQRQALPPGQHQAPPPPGQRRTAPPGQAPRQAQPPSRRGRGVPTPPVPTSAPAPMPAPVPQPTSWQDLPGSSDRGPIFVWNPDTGEYTAADRAGEPPRRNRRGDRGSNRRSNR